MTQSSTPEAVSCIAWGDVLPGTRSVWVTQKQIGAKIWKCMERRKLLLRHKLRTEGCLSLKIKRGLVVDSAVLSNSSQERRNK